MNILDLFSGIGGFSLGLQKAGFEIEKHYFSEINKHSEACYKYHFPDAISLGDITKLNTDRINEKIDIITFGSPCQNFSLAGNRKGLKGDQSSLIKEAMRLVRELQPSIFIWENVKGTFSSNARQDFWAILQAFTNLGDYRLEWQLLNTKWFLPQNRERIYLIGHLAGKSRSRVFPIGEDDKIFRKERKGGKIYTQVCSAITGSTAKMRAEDTYVKVADYRYDEGLRVRKNSFCPTLRNKTGAGMSAQPLVIGAIRGRNPHNPSDRRPSIKLEQRLEINKNNISNTLSSVQKDNVVVCPSNIRRLTEIECERLQGFPDDWTKYGCYDDGIKKISKTQRYGMLGNAVTVDVVEEIGKRILSI
ncbi:DNA (cytosine-5-)-methyltransferase [Riemerella anatipestifer]|nr:DNA (cytosine-5-)-methyltransferase [Riemerella anatipestifer]MDD1596163.1 DNA (cytosine-5-)-methyltransferase [Riemerella anatipestifer]